MKSSFLILVFQWLRPTYGFSTRCSPPRRRRQREYFAEVLPEVEFWLDLRTTFLEPATAMQNLYRGVTAEMKGQELPKGQVITGVVVWRDPGSALLDIGDLPVVAVDPPSSASLSGLITAPASTVTATVLEPPFDANKAVALLDESSCLLVDGGATPSSWNDETLPLVELLATAAKGRARVLVSLYDATQLNECTRALVLSGLASNALQTLGEGKTTTTSVGDSELNEQNPQQEKQTKSLPTDGLGVALPPDPRLWSHAVMYNVN